MSDAYVGQRFRAIGPISAMKNRNSELHCRQFDSPLMRVQHINSERIRLVVVGAEDYTRELTFIPHWLRPLSPLEELAEASE